jgi:hypothetical protein
LAARDRKNLPVVSSIFSWADSPAICDDFASPSWTNASLARADEVID